MTWNVSVSLSFLAARGHSHLPRWKAEHPYCLTSVEGEKRRQRQTYDIIKNTMIHTFTAEKNYPNLIQEYRMH